MWVVSTLNVWCVDVLDCLLVLGLGLFEIIGGFTYKGSVFFILSLDPYRISWKQLYINVLYATWWLVV